MTTNSHWTRSKKRGFRHPDRASLLCLGRAVRRERVLLYRHTAHTEIGFDVSRSQQSDNSNYAPPAGDELSGLLSHPGFGHLSAR